MRIIWDDEFKQFEAQLAAGSNWATEQQAVKEAGFKTEGPPEWKWISFRASALTKLKSAQPALNLSIYITSAAMTQYKRLREQEDTNAAVRKAFRQAKKLAGKERQEPGPEIDWDAKTEPVFYVKYVPPPLPSTLCSVCRMPVYYYESQDPPLCLDCEFEEF